MNGRCFHCGELSDGDYCLPSEASPLEDFWCCLRSYEQECTLWALYGAYRPAASELGLVDRDPNEGMLWD